ncbi:MAG: aminoacyl-tRNA hydrolase [Oscillospiraceae bacterium]
MNLKDDIWGLFKKIESGEKAGGPPEFIIAGLGNPGKDYERTRHNTGFMAMDRVAAECGAKIDKLKFKSYTALATLGGHRVFLMKPCTFMNLSGEAVTAAMEFYKIPIQNVIVVFDDTTLPVGKMRIRRKGSDGGHNGIKNIIYLSGSNEFPRVKIGIGQRPEGWDLADWVLGRYSDEDLKALSPIFDNTVEALKLIMDGKAEEAMGKFN